MVQVYTIGFTRRSAEQFFELIRSDYEPRYLAELRERHVETVLVPADFDGTILLCSEPTTQRCHRRLCLEYLAPHWGTITRVDL